MTRVLLPLRRVAFRWFALFVAVTVGLASCAGSSGSDRSARAADASYLDVMLPTFVDDEEFRLRDLAGAPAVVNFFASWCVPCVTEMPDIERVKQDVGDDVAFVGIDVEDSEEDALELVERTDITWQIARDNNGELLRAVGGVAMPTTLLLDSNGNIVEHHTGAISRDALRKLIMEHFDIEVGS